MDITSVFHAVILGIVEGVTEFLPISSTGHLILASRILSIPQTDFIKSFEIVIQFAAILSVVAIYWQSFIKNIEVMKRVIVAFIPTAIIGLVLYKIIKTFLLGETTVVLISLFVVGIILVVFEWLHKEKSGAVQSIEGISYAHAFTIGVVQSIAMIPGVSRSAATILGGLSLNISRRTIVEFSFLLAVPTMCAATALDVIKNYQVFEGANIGFLLIGFITSFVVAYLSIKFLISYVQRHTFIAFGIYRIALALVFWLLLRLSLIA